MRTDSNLVVNAHNLVDLLSELLILLLAHLPAVQKLLCNLSWASAHLLKITNECLKSLYHAYWIIHVSAPLLTLHKDD